MSFAVECFNSIVTHKITCAFKIAQKHIAEGDHVHQVKLTENRRKESCATALSGHIKMVYVVGQKSENEIIPTKCLIPLFSLIKNIFSNVQ